jgi:opacity protein-like surface antigen
MTRAICFSMVLGVLYACPAGAQALSGLYFGGGFGRAENTYDTGFVDDQFKDALTESGETLKFTSSTVQRWDNTWLVNAGYMAWSYVGVDALFLHVGELTHRATGEVKTSAGTNELVDGATVTSHGPALSLLVRLPLAESFALDMRVGDYYAKTDLTIDAAYKSKSTRVQTSQNGSSLLAGLGASYTFLQHFSVRLDYFRINDAGDGASVGKYSANLATIGATYTF